MVLVDFVGETAQHFLDAILECWIEEPDGGQAFLRMLLTSDTLTWMRAEALRHLGYAVETPHDEHVPYRLFPLCYTRAHRDLQAQLRDGAEIVVEVQDYYDTVNIRAFLREKKERPCST